MKKASILFILAILLLFASCTADEIETQNIQNDELQVDVDPSTVKPPTGG